MKPPLKYAITTVLYATEAHGIWEHELFDRLLAHYRAVELRALREELVSLSTVGWLHIAEEREYAGQLLRRYALADHIRPFIRFQLNLDKLLGQLGTGAGTAGPAGTAAAEPAPGGAAVAGGAA
jgi:hypothetical protein